MSRERFAAETGVSRETLASFDTYAALLEKWNRRINLVAPSTLPAIWDRHFFDSAQLWLDRPADLRSWADLGSGAGFPGLVIGLLARDAGLDLDLTLVEADSRKAAFLRTAAQAIAIDARVEVARAEALAPLGADVISARALAPLRRLLPLAVRHLGPGGRLLFLKGKGHQDELTEAREAWHIPGEVRPSLTDPEGARLVLDRPEPFG